MRTFERYALVFGLFVLVIGATGFDDQRGLLKNGRQVGRRVSQSCSGVGYSCFDFYDANGPNTADVLNIVSAQMSYLAYNDSANAIDIAKQYGATNAFVIDNSSSAMHILVATTPSSIMVAFRGTVPSIVQNLATDAKDTLVQTTLAGGPVFVHQGFLNAFQSVYPQIVSAIQQDDPSGQKELYFTGHSLGAALASLAAAFVSDGVHSVSAVFTFASPRVGDEAWNSAYNQLGLNGVTMRFVYYYDIVPLLPPTDAGYVHVGRPVFISQDYSTCTENDNQDEVNICGNALLAGFADVGCAAVEVALSPGIGLCVSDSNLIQAECEAVVNLILSGGVTGNVCCDLIDAGYQDGSQMTSVILSYHSMTNYIKGVETGCASSCSWQEYQDCGNTPSQALAPTPMQVPLPIPSQALAPTPMQVPLPIPSQALAPTPMQVPLPNPTPTPTPTLSTSLAPSQTGSGVQAAAQTNTGLPTPTSAALGYRMPFNSFQMLFMLLLAALVPYN